MGELAILPRTDVIEQNGDRVHGQMLVTILANGTINFYLGMDGAKASGVGASTKNRGTVPCEAYYNPDHHYFTLVRFPGEAKRRKGLIGWLFKKPNSFRYTASTPKFRSDCIGYRSVVEWWSHGNVIEIKLPPDLKVIDDVDVIARYLRTGQFVPEPSDNAHAVTKTDYLWTRTENSYLNMLDIQSDLEQVMIRVEKEIKRFKKLFENLDRPIPTDDE